MTSSRISRRNLLLAGWNAAATNVAAGLCASQAEAKNERKLSPAALNRFAASVDSAYSFLRRMMDSFASGSTLRLIQSYSDQQGLKSSSFTYDDALCIHAFLLRGRPDDIARAQILGDALLYAQQNDSLQDGRLRQAYSVNSPSAQGAYLKAAEDPFSFLSTFTGDLAWAGLALAQLYRRTGKPSYLRGAVSIGIWIFNHAYDTRGTGGFNGGVDASNTPVTYKSTEHNIDAYGLFVMLAVLTGNGDWSARAQHASRFVAAMWNRSGPFFWTGTGSDGATLNTSNIPEDVQTWSYLALGQSTYAPSLDWAKTNLKTVDTPQAINSTLTPPLRFTGLTFASLSLRTLTPSAPGDLPPDPAAVWFEGSAHGAAALLARDCSTRQHAFESAGDLRAAASLLDNIRLAQSNLGTSQTIAGAPIEPGEGIVAASSVCDTGFGSSYRPNLHTGATAWYLIAAQAGNPFQLGYRRSGNCS